MPRPESLLFIKIIIKRQTVRYINRKGQRSAGRDGDREGQKKLEKKIRVRKRKRINYHVHVCNKAINKSKVINAKKFLCYLC